MACVDVIVSDFDHTLFKNNFGLIHEVVNYLEQRGLPVWIVTYRNENQEKFIKQVLNETSIDLIGIGFADSRKKDPATKLAIIDSLSSRYNIVEALDDDEQVVVRLRQRGINAKRVVAQ